MLNLINVDPSDVATDKFKEIIKSIEDGSYNEEDFASSEPEDSEMY